METKENLVLYGVIALFAAIITVGMLIHFIYSKIFPDRFKKRRVLYTPPPEEEGKEESKIEAGPPHHLGG